MRLVAILALLALAGCDRGAFVHRDKTRLALIEQRSSDGVCLYGGGDVHVGGYLETWSPPTRPDGRCQPEAWLP